MNDIKTIRSAFGLTQEALAQVLDVSLPHLKLIEAGKRKLPAGSVLFVKCLVDEAKTTVPPPPAFMPVSEWNETRLLELGQRLRKLNKALDSLQRKKTQAEALKQVSPVFMQRFPQDKFPSPALRMEALGLKADAWLKGNDAEQETKLHLERVGVLAQLDWLRRRSA